ncbi:MAG: TlpA disulfide reductase family protein [Pseudomonadota bacterium]
MRLAFAALATLMLAACGTASDDSHGISTDPNAATVFFTENTTPPETARDIRGDGVLRDADERPYGYAFLGKPLPDFNAPRVNGPDWSPRQIETWTIIDVWGIWCGDCMADAPYAAALSRAVEQDPDLDFLSIHTPPSPRRADEAFGDYGSVEAYFAEAGYSYPTVLDLDASVRETMQIAWTPTYLLVSPDGIVRGFRTDLSVAGGEPVKDFLQDVARVKSETVVDPRPRLPAFGIEQAGGIRSTTPFTQSSVEVSFPGMMVRAASAMSEGESYPVFRVMEPGIPPQSRGLLFTVWPDWDKGHVSEVTTRNGAVAGPAGTRIGETRLGDLPASFGAECVSGELEVSDSVVCSVAEDSRVVFRWIFGPPEVTDGPLGAAPDEVQAEGVLREMSYFPPSYVP